MILESSALITDFSSVFFDFTYMLRPTLYYQFDSAEYRRGHYKEGYFSYEKDGFGPVVNTCSDLADQIERLLVNNFALESPYAERANSFFERRDDKNCERITAAIEKFNEQRLGVLSRSS
jgi:CDP-glycerol glycerophosphotransferase